MSVNDRLLLIYSVDGAFEKMNAIFYRP